MSDLISAPQYQLARLLFERSLAGIYFIAFLSAYNQFTALLGEKGLLPVTQFLKNVTFREAPSIFHWGYSDKLLKIICLIGMGVSLIIALGFLSNVPILVHLLSWLTLYGLYLSIVNVGQEFYGFGWETMLLEAGFFAAFMGPQWITPSWIPIFILRWMLFRTELGAGLIKLRGDPCWRNLTCLYYHHETQPLPNPLSRFFHHQPKVVQRAGVIFSHFCQIVAPFGLFLPYPFALGAGFFLIVHQLILVISGNYSWLNWLTIVLAFLTIPNMGEGGALKLIPTPLWFEVLQWIILTLALFLSYRPLLNLFSKQQFMNYCWNRWHLVGAYGAFGSVTKERYEIVIEGSTDSDPTSESWKEYGFKGKPVELNRIPPIVAPYHLRLDWMIWFLPFTVNVIEGQILVRGHRVWFIRLLLKLLLNDRNMLKLFRYNPFSENAPLWVRARFYRYEFTSKDEKKQTGQIWKRSLLGDFCPAISLGQVKQILGQT